MPGMNKRARSSGSGLLKALVEESFSKYLVRKVDMDPQSEGTGSGIEQRKRRRAVFLFSGGGTGRRKRHEQMAKTSTQSYQFTCFPARISQTTPQLATGTVLKATQ